MKDGFLGFIVGIALCLGIYVAWEDHRHVPVIIKEIKVPVPVPIPMPMPESSASRIA